MNVRTDDLRIRDIRELTTPEELMREFACTEAASAAVSAGRSGMQEITSVHRERPRRCHGSDNSRPRVRDPVSCTARELGSRFADDGDDRHPPDQYVRRKVLNQVFNTIGSMFYFPVIMFLKMPELFHHRKSP